MPCRSWHGPHKQVLTLGKPQNLGPWAVAQGPGQLPLWMHQHWRATAHVSCIITAAQVAPGSRRSRRRTRGFAQKLSFASIRNMDVVPTMGRSMTGCRQCPEASTADPRFGKAGRLGKGAGHAQSKSVHSQSASIFHISDPDSDNYIPSPPPVARVPDSFGMPYRDDTGPFQDYEEVVMDPKTPYDFALHAVFIHLATPAGKKIGVLLRQPLDREVLLTVHVQVLGLTRSSTRRSTRSKSLRLGNIAQKHAKMPWRRSQSENVGSGYIAHLAQTSGAIRKEILGLLNECKSLAATYIMCSALVAVLQQLSRDALADALGYSLEETIFPVFTNHAINSELYVTLLGPLAIVWSVTQLLHSVWWTDTETQIYENLVQGLKYIKIKVRLHVFFAARHCPYAVRLDVAAGSV